MNSTKSLFGELSVQFTAHPENIATEALAYLLRTYPSAVTSLVQMCHAAGVPMPENLTFTTQVEQVDKSRPDLVGFSNGQTVFVIEAKFWAGLTPYQPVSYLNALPSDRLAFLLFLCPQERLSILWAKLRQRCRQELLPFSERDSELVGKLAEIDCQRVLGITSWRHVLNTIMSKAELDGYSNLAADARQLIGLCDRMDAQAFLPLRAEELDRKFADRMQQFLGLVDKVFSQLRTDTESAHWYSHPGGGSAEYTRSFQIDEVGFTLAFSPPLWARAGETPLWLRVHSVSDDGSWIKTHELTVAATELEPSIPRVDEGGGVAIGLELPLGEDEDAVISAVSAQTKSFCEHFVRRLNR